MLLDYMPCRGGTCCVRRIGGHVVSYAVVPGFLGHFVPPCWIVLLGYVVPCYCGLCDVTLEGVKMLCHAGGGGACRSTPHPEAFVRRYR